MQILPFIWVRTVCLSVWTCVSFVCCLVDFLPSNSLFNRIAVFSLDDGNGWRKPFTFSKRQQSHIFIIIYNGSSENQSYLILFHIDGPQGEFRWLFKASRKHKIKCQNHSVCILKNPNSLHCLGQQNLYNNTDKILSTSPAERRVEVLFALFERQTFRARICCNDPGSPS